MGLFDSLHDGSGREFQTKALDCILHNYFLGERICVPNLPDFQIQILGVGSGCESFATIRGQKLVGVNVPRDPNLPLLDYDAEQTTIGEENG